MCFLASATKHAVLILTILTFFFLVTSDGAVLLFLLALCCGTCFASAVTVKNRKSLMHTAGAVLIYYISALLVGVQKKLLKMF